MRQEKKRLVVEGNAIYEIDRECILRQQSQKGARREQDTSEQAAAEQASRLQRESPEETPVL